MSPDLARRATAETVGTAMLLAAVVGSGIMGEKLAGGNVAQRDRRLLQAFGAELHALGVFCFGHAVGIEEHKVTRR